MVRLVRSYPAFVCLVLALLWAAVAMPATAGQTQPGLYRVTLAASDRAARSKLVGQGLALDAIGPGTATTIVGADQLTRLRRQGLRLIEVVPLDFPPADSSYHSYTETIQAVLDAAGTYPQILQITDAGFSLEGRAIPAVRIGTPALSGYPPKPAVLFFALTHGREHLTVEMALEIILLFTNNYGRDPAITNLVNQREIWVLPDVNPDGAEYDVATGAYAYWRKNRRPNLDGSYGVDLNRNYGYRWGCCGGSSAFPGDDTYRGTAPFSEPETQVVRDFVTAHPNINAAITFHTFSELILYPYGYTDLANPPDMDPADYRAFETLANAMAQTNGYTAGQANTLYTTSGDAVDWLYGEHGIFAFTFEMFPKSGDPGFYPPASLIERETRRNDAAVIYLARMADNPLKVIGMGGDNTPPTVTLAFTATEPLWVGQPVTLTVSASDDAGVTLLGWQSGGDGFEIGAASPLTGTWIPELPGTNVLQAVAFDASGNQGISQPITLTAYLASQATLVLPDPSGASLFQALDLTFTRPITGSTLALSFAPPAGQVSASGDGLAVQITHAPFKPATAYTLTLAGGYGPGTLAIPAEWAFTTESWQSFAPLIVK